MRLSHFLSFLPVTGYGACCHPCWSSGHGVLPLWVCPWFPWEMSPAVELLSHRGFTCSQMLENAILLGGPACPHQPACGDSPSSPSSPVFGGIIYLIGNLTSIKWSLVFAFSTPVRLIDCSCWLKFLFVSLLFIHFAHLSIRFYNFFFYILVSNSLFHFNTVKIHPF